MAIDKKNLRSMMSESEKPLTEQDVNTIDFRDLKTTPASIKKRDYFLKIFL